MAEIDPKHRTNHIVVIMFENRSFDNVLGSLYKPGERPSFEGVLGKNLSNPIPVGVPGSAKKAVPVHQALNMDTPDPDPGEEHPHVNTQMYGTVSPAANQFKPINEMQSPFNAPNPDVEPTMDGFVKDYINAFQTEMKRPPSYDEYAQTMAYYTPDQLPVITTLAKGFACFDHWFCEVPSQTYCNRSFIHAASSSGKVNNSPVGKFEAENDAPTIFERLEDAKKSWKVYIDPEQLVPATALIHARRLMPRFTDRFRTIFDFYHDAREGELPTYSFIEPNMLHPHTDMHPPGSCRLRHELRIKASNAMLGGEQLLAQVYEAVRDGTHIEEGKSNWANTLLLVTFDEHGGIYDHVPPPRVPPPTAPTGREEEGFRFDRSGMRVPAIAISAWVDEGTVVNEEYRHTSVIRTLRERWSLGAPLTQRDAVARDIVPLLSRTSPRPREEWPVVPHRSSFLEKVEEEFFRPLGCLENNLVGEALAHEARVNGSSPAGDLEKMGVKDARTHLKRIRDNMFPGVANGRTS
jgi:phospholipase C